MARTCNMPDRRSSLPQQAVISTIASLRNRQGGVLPAAKRLIMSAAMQSDNEGNVLADGHLIAAIVAALPKVVMPDRRPALTADIEDAARALDRALAMDRLLPSYGNVITIAALQVRFDGQHCFLCLSCLPGHSSVAVHRTRCSKWDIPGCNEVSYLAFLLLQTR